jgi:hypothetical protein
MGAGDAGRGEVCMSSDWTTLGIEQSAGIAADPNATTIDAAMIDGTHRVHLHPGKRPNGDAAVQAAEARSQALRELRGRLMATPAGRGYADVRAEVARADLAGKRAKFQREREGLERRRARLVAGEESTEKLADELLALDVRLGEIVAEVERLDRQAATLKEVADTRLKAALAALGEARSNIAGAMLGECQSRIRTLGERVAQVPEVIELLDAMAAAAIERDAARSLGGMTADAALLDKLIDLNDVS